MSESRKTKVVDGYTALKAAQRAGHQTTDFYERKASSEENPSPPKPEVKKKPEEGAKLGTHIGRTTLPTRYEIVCHECGFSFSQTGKADSTMCSKCKCRLTLKSQSIENTWTDSLKTAGAVHIKPAGIVKSGEIIGGDIILEGTVEGGSLKASRSLEIRPGAKFSEQHVSFCDLILAEGVHLTFKRKLTCRNLTVSGHVKGKITVEKMATIKPGGLLEGELQGEHLVVEGGGGLKAKIAVQKKPEIEDKKKPSGEKTSEKSKTGLRRR